MKVVAKELPGQTKSYPKLMVSDQGTIILFSACGVGTILASKSHGVGHHATSWSMECFKDFNGEVILSN